MRILLERAVSLIIDQGDWWAGQSVFHFHFRFRTCLVFCVIYSTLLPDYCAIDRLNGSRNDSWSRVRTLARAFACVLARTWLQTHARQAETVYGTSKVHVVVDHSSGNSRPPAVVQACMNVGRHLRRPPPPSREVAEKKRETRKQAGASSLSLDTRESFACQPQSSSGHRRVHPRLFFTLRTVRSSSRIRAREMCSEKIRVDHRSWFMLRDRKFARLLDRADRWGYIVDALVLT